MDADPRDIDLVDRAERYGDEVGPTRQWMAVAVLIAFTAALFAALAVVLATKATGPFVSPPDDRPAVAYRSGEVRIPAVLKVHGQSARRTE